MIINWNNHAAFEPFYTDSVTVEAVRKGGQDCGGTFRCMVSRDGYDAPIDDSGSSHVNRRTITVTIPKSGSDGWYSGGKDEKPRPGDSVTTPNDGVQWSVFEVDEDDMDFILKAREKGDGK